MQVAPDFEVFAAGYGAGQACLLRTTLVADLETPVAAFLKLRHERRGAAFLLESVEGGAVRGRYSMVGLDPDLIWRCRGGVAEMCREPPGREPRFIRDERPPLDSLRALIAESAITVEPDLPPMAAGLFGYLGYDMVRLMERLPPPNPDVLGVPDAILVRPTVMVVFDAVRDEISLITPVRPQPGVSAKAAYETRAGADGRCGGGARTPASRSRSGTTRAFVAEPPVSNTTPAEYKSMVEQAKEYIRAGDIFQVVLSQRFEAAVPAAALRALPGAAARQSVAVPVLPRLRGVPDRRLQSPEILVRVREGTVTIRPIAGTRPRGATAAEDQPPRRRAAGRSEGARRAPDAARPRPQRRRPRRRRIGTVNVTDSFFLERYSHVMHIVSNVEGRLDPRRDALDALVAGFPAGTVSGAPKVRAMEIIDELEPDKRGPYAGCIGYFGSKGDMDTCIALRTAVVKDGRMHVQAGAGIVYDSDPEAEQQECINKAKALFRAAEEAVRFASRAGRGQ